MERLQQLGMSPEEAAKVAGVGRTLIFAEIRSGRLVAHKCGRRTIVRQTDIDGWLANLPKAGGGARKLDGARR